MFDILVSSKRAVSPNRKEDKKGKRLLKKSTLVLKSKTASTMFSQSKKSVMVSLSPHGKAVKVSCGFSVIRS